MLLRHRLLRPSPQRPQDAGLSSLQRNDYNGLANFLEATAWFSATDPGNSRGSWRSKRTEGHFYTLPPTRTLETAWHAARARPNSHQTKATATTTTSTVLPARNWDFKCYYTSDEPTYVRGIVLGQSFCRPPDPNMLRLAVPFLSNPTFWRDWSDPTEHEYLNSSFFCLIEGRRLPSNPEKPEDKLRGRYMIDDSKQS